MIDFEFNMRHVYFVLAYSGAWTELMTIKSVSAEGVAQAGEIYSIFKLVPQQQCFM